MLELLTENAKLILKRAIELNDSGQYLSAIKLIESKINTSLNSIDNSVLRCFLASNYFDNADYKIALEYYNDVLKISPYYELASLGKYLTLHELGEDDKSFAELKRYLKKNEAKLYRVTLEELLEGLDEGYMANYEKEIWDLAKKNNVTIIPGANQH